MSELLSKKNKLTVSSERLVSRGISCSVRVSPVCYILSCARKKEDLKGGKIE